MLFVLNLYVLAQVRRIVWLGWRRAFWDGVSVYKIFCPSKSMLFENIAVCRQCIMFVMYAAPFITYSLGLTHSVEQVKPFVHARVVKVLLHPGKFKSWRIHTSLFHVFDLVSRFLSSLSFMCRCPDIMYHVVNIVILVV